MRMLAALVSLALASAAGAADLAAAPAAASAEAPVAPPAAGSPAVSPAPTTVPYGKASGLIPGVLIGPKLAVLPIPSPLGLGAEARIADTIGVSLDYNFIPSVKMNPTSDSLAEVKASYRDLSGAIRWFPWHASFHLGAALGSRTLKANGTDQTTGQAASLEVTSTYLAPEIGWRWIWGSGFFMGLDLGYQVILSSKQSLSLPASMPPSDKQDVKDAADRLATFGFPILSLLQLGWYL